MANIDWIVFEGKDGKLEAIKSPHNGLQERMMKNGVKVLASLSAKTGTDAIDYVEELIR